MIINTYILNQHRYVLTTFPSPSPSLQAQPIMNVGPTSGMGGHGVMPGAFAAPTSLPPQHRPSRPGRALARVL